MSTIPAASKKLFSTSAIPVELGKKLSKLFDSSEYHTVLKEIEKSPFKNTKPLMTLKAECHRFLKQEHEEEFSRTRKQIDFLDKNNSPGFSVPVKEISI